MHPKERLKFSLAILVILLTASPRMNALGSTPVPSPTSTPKPTASPQATRNAETIELTLADLTAELTIAEDRGKAKGAQAMEAELRPRLDDQTQKAKDGAFWRIFGPWIAVAEALAAAAGMVWVFIQAFTLGARQ
jgi:hypothetical protein